MNKKNVVAHQIRKVAENRKALYNFFLLDELECGVVLLGSEVKSLRNGKSSIGESYASIEANELWLINSNIPNYRNSKTFFHDEKRKRKLLIKKKEFNKLQKNTGRDGMTLVPLSLYFNETGKVKIRIGIAKGKKNTDKRQVEKKRDWDQQKSRLLKNKG